MSLNSPDILIQAQNLARSYGPHAAIRELSLELRRGEVLGLLGPNGAGKTTTLRMLTGCLAPQQGRIEIAGFDLARQPREAKARMGYLPERPPLYPELRVDEFLRFCGRLHGLRGSHLSTAVGDASDACGLNGVSHRLIASLSKGYQQRLGLAQAIVHRPDLIILDEPTVGLDPNQLREIRRLIRELARDRAVILSSHILPEIQAVCDRVIILAAGRVVYTDHLHHWQDQAREHSLLLGLRRPPAETDLAAFAGVEAVTALSGNRFALRLSAGADPREALALAAAQHDWGLYLLATEQRSLDEVFAEMTGA